MLHGDVGCCCPGGYRKGAQTKETAWSDGAWEVTEHPQGQFVGVLAPRRRLGGVLVVLSGGEARHPSHRSKRTSEKVKFLFTTPNVSMKIIQAKLHL